MTSQPMIDTTAQPMSAEELAEIARVAKGDLTLESWAAPLWLGRLLATIAQSAAREAVLVEALKMLTDETTEYIKINNIPGALKNHVIFNALNALASPSTAAQALLTRLESAEEACAKLVPALTRLVKLSDAQDSEEGCDADEHDATIAEAKKLLATLTTELTTQQE